MNASPLLRLFAPQRDTQPNTESTRRRASERPTTPIPALPPKTAKRPGLQVLEGKVRTSYSRGAAEIARQYQRDVGNTGHWLEAELKTRAKLELEVLSPDDWAKKLPALPYGITSVRPLGRGFLAIVPASGANVLTQEAMAVERHVSPKWRAKLKRAGIPYAQAAKTFAELAAKHELGHVYSGRIDLPVEPAWFGEFLATYLAYADMRTRQPEKAVIWDALLDGCVRRERPKNHRLDDFATSLEEGLPAFLWHQGRYQERVRQVFDSMGMSFIQRLVESMPAGEPLTTRRLLTRLDAIAPGFIAWADAGR